MPIPFRDPERYGVVEFDGNRKAVSLEEKPAHPRSNFAVPGIYFYDTTHSLAEELKPSPRGEIEITDINRRYLDEGKLQVKVLGRAVAAWLDAGTHESLLQAAMFVQAVEDRQGIEFSCVEEYCLPYGIYRPGTTDAMRAGNGRE